MNFPSPDDIKYVPTVEHAEARAAAAYVAERLGSECRPVLEALGLIGYFGHDHSSGHFRQRWREGAVG